MIVKFGIENFGCIKEEQVLSFEATKDERLEGAYVMRRNGMRLLKIALIYGANASGKTTILEALQCLRDLVLAPKHSKHEQIDIHPFLFDSTTSQAPSRLFIEFLQGDGRYRYEVVLNRQAIVREALTRFHPTKANVFKRETDLQEEITTIRFGGTVTIKKSAVEALQANTLWNNTVLGGFLKTNIACEELKEATDWFKDYLRPLIYTRTTLDGYVTRLIDQKEIRKEHLLSILQKADLNISDIVLHKEEEDIPAELLAILEQADEGMEKMDVGGKKKIARLHVELSHTVNHTTYNLPLEVESLGTRRYYGLAGILSLLIGKPVAFPIDELENSLHPDLYKYFLLAFLMNAQRSQLIATTHNRELLDDRDLFRNDAIWITNRNQDASTSLYALAELPTSVIRNTSNILNAFKEGRLGGIPNLGDYYIDLETENGKEK